jgi:hypothetical protein
MPARCAAMLDGAAWRLVLSRPHAPVAQLDRVSASEAEGHWFESSQARHFPQARKHSRSVPAAQRANLRDGIPYLEIQEHASQRGTRLRRISFDARDRFVGAIASRISGQVRSSM